MSAQHIPITEQIVLKKYLWAALATGCVAGLVIFVTFTKLEQSATVLGILSVVGGLGIAALFQRERSLIEQCRRLERTSIEETCAHNARLEQLYMKSMAPLVEFDVDTLIIRRASIGFYDLLRFGIGVKLEGEHLESVLGLEQGGLESLTSHISKGSSGLRRAMRCQCAEGESINLMMSAYYLEGSNMVEAAFFVPRSTSSVDKDQGQMASELERHRHGMIRREERILELKGDINRLLSDLNQPARFKVDDRTDDTHFSLKLDVDTTRMSGDE